MESPDSIVDSTNDAAIAAVTAVEDAAVTAVDTLDTEVPVSEVPASELIDLAVDDADAIDLTSSADAPARAPEVDASTGAPSVDALEEQLGSLQGAMDKLQAGDLDGAERTIEALEQKIVSLKN